MKEDISPLIIKRGPKASDINFILSTWLMGIYYGNSWFREIDKDVFMAHYHDVIVNILNTKTTKVELIALKEDEDTVLGYSVISHAHQKPVLHWVFVKKAWRNLGIAKRLVDEEIDICTHMTAIGLKLKQKRPMVFNPFLI